MVVGQRDRVAAGLGQVDGAGAGPHEQARCAEAVQEVPFVAGTVGGGADHAAQSVAGHLIALVAGGLVQLRGRWVVLGGAPSVDAVQPHLSLTFATFGDTGQ